MTSIINCPPLTLKSVSSFPDPYSPVLIKYAHWMTPDPYITPYIKLNFPLPSFLLSHLKEWHNIDSVIQDRTLEVMIYTVVVNTMCQIPCRNSEHIPKLGDYIPKLQGLLATTVHSCHLFLENCPYLRGAISWGT